MTTIKAVFIDLNGTLHIEDEPTPGAVEALTKLRQSDVYIKFVTNTSKESRKTLHENLVAMGFTINLEEIHSPLKAANEYIRRYELNPLYMISESASNDLPESCSNSENTTKKDYDSVVIGLAPDSYTYETLNKAFNILRSNTKHKLIALNESKYVRTCEELVLGTGFYSKGLEYSASVKAVVIGKPSEEFFKSAIPPDIKLNECVMIGDDVDDDIKGAMKLGMKAVQVKTGKYLPEVVAVPAPTKLVDNFAKAVDWILETKAKNAKK